MTLAAILGEPHPDFLLEKLTARQLQDWLAWLKKYHPFPDRNDPFFATLISATANVWGGRTSPEDFLIYQDPLEHLEDEMTAAQLRAKLGLK